jgi:hypothetical protein
MISKVNLLAVATVAVLGTVTLGSSNAFSAISVWRGGSIDVVYAEPDGQLTIQLNVAGPCGSVFYHVRRSNANLSLMTEITMTSFQTTRKMGLLVIDCVGDRNIVSHGYVSK